MRFHKAFIEINGMDLIENIDVKNHQPINQNINEKLSAFIAIHEDIHQTIKKMERIFGLFIFTDFTTLSIDIAIHTTLILKVTDF